MALPKYDEMFNIFLEALSDGSIRSAKEVQKYIENKLNLSDEDLSETLSSGQRTFPNRVGWTKVYLEKAGLVATPSRARYQITEAGLKALKSGKSIDLEYLETIPAFSAFKNGKNITITANQSNTEDDDNKTPQEIIEGALQQVNSTLSDQVIGEIMKLSPAQFERLVVKLLLVMGYGNGITDAGKVTKLSKDGGIDGIIKEDKFGFDNIYIQAKQWALTQTVGRPEIQKFVGALAGQHAQKGLFITTAKYSADARDYVERSSGAKVVLVDGEALVKLMIQNNLGVSVEHVYEVKRLDSDFFEDEL